MPQVRRLSVDAFHRGYNSRDDGRSLREGEVQDLQNLYPGNPPRPREGVTRFAPSLPEAPRALFPWRDGRGEAVLAVCGRALYLCRRGAVPHLLAADLLPSATCAVSFERFLEWGFLLTDVAGYAFVVEEVRGSLRARHANIAAPLDAVVLNAIPATGGQIPPNTFRAYGITWINRDNESDPQLHETGYQDGLCESCENRAHRIVARVTGNQSAIHLAWDARPDDPQVTHARLWGTLSAPSALEAEGLELRWLADVPVQSGSGWSYDDRASDGARRGELNLLQTVGQNEIPPAAFAKYHGGLLWVGGANRGESPGRVFYSMPVQNATRPVKFLSLFNETSGFVDVATDESSPAVALSASRNDLYFFAGSRRVYRLREGDISQPLELLTESYGLAHAGSLTSIHQDLYYLSPEGPVVLQGALIELVRDFAAGEVWPHGTAGRGALLSSDRVAGFWARQTWWLTNGATTVGFHQAADGQSRGALRVVFGDADLRLLHPVVAAEDCTVFATGTSLWRFLDEGFQADNYRLFTVAVQSPKLPVDPRRPTQVAELYDARLHARFSDNGTLRLTVTGDDFRFAKAFGYVQRGPESPLQNTDSADAFRHSIQQGLPAGLYGASFELRATKLFRPPFDFLLRGLELGVILRPGHPADWVSLSPPEEVPPVESGLLLVDPQVLALEGP